MGNGSSQSVVLGSTRSLGHAAPMHYREDRYQRTPAKYAQPMNRVLPKPVAGQRLRSTDNGHILHSAGTIRGLKPGSPTPQDHEDGDPEVRDILKKRSERLERDEEEETYRQANLRYHRMFHSDPDISRARPTGVYSSEIVESVVSRRSGGGAAVRASKLKQRKKARAPDPPPNSDHYSGQFQRRSRSSTDISYNPSEPNGKCKCISRVPEWRPKNKAPSPPCYTSDPPPPPPLPKKTPGSQVPDNDHSRTPTRNNGDSTANSSTNPTFERQSRGVSVNQSRGGGSRSENRQEDHAHKIDLRTTVFDSKSDLSGVTKKSALLPHLPDPFQREIEAVTKKIAETRHKDSVVPQKQDTNIKTQKQSLSPEKTFLPKQYYFSDKDVFRTDNVAPKQNGISHSSQNVSNGQSSKTFSQDHSKLNGHAKIPQPTGSHVSKRTESPLQRFSPTRRNLKSIGKGLVPSTKDEVGRNDYGPIFDHSELHPMPYQREDSDIDIRLRPVLPRKTLDVPSFSRKEAWQALGSSSHGSSNQSTSDESVTNFGRNNGYFMGHDLKQNNCTTFGNYKIDKSHWTPRQDLDDSDSSSMNSDDDAVVPKHQLGEFSTRFSLPTMFSNLRPIGAEFSAPKKHIDTHIKSGFVNHHEVGKQKHPSKFKYTPSSTPSANAELNAVSHFKRFLGMKNKYMSEEDVSVSDSNWTFGEHGLQKKRGKHYASDLMLSEKKKYELMVKNDFGQFLGDILVTKSNDIDNGHSSNSGHSNFSFYSTEGHVMHLPENAGPSVGSNVDNSGKLANNNRGRRKMDKSDQAHSQLGNYKKKFTSPAIKELENKRGIDLIRILEDEVRKRRVKEKLSIRQQLQMMKRLESEDDDDTDEEIDEAYFTEQKSLEGTSPPYFPSSQLQRSNGIVRHNGVSGSSPLTHWTSSPALFQDNGMGKQMPLRNGVHSGSSAMSSPDPVAWGKPSTSDKWFQRRPDVSQNRRSGDKSRRLTEESVTAMERRSSSDDFPGVQKDKRKTSRYDQKSSSIYKQLMDIVRKEEKQLKKAQGDSPASRDSSYSQRESTHSSSSHDSLSSSSNSCNGSSSDHVNDYSGKSGIPANDEFDCTDVKRSSGTGFVLHPGDNSRVSQSPFHAAFVQPFTPNKGYRPVPFDVAVPSASNNCRMPAIKEGCQVQAKVS